MEFLKIWTDFREVMAPLEYEEKGRLFDAMLLYADTGEEPENLWGNERFIWPVAKRDIDRMNSKCETNRANGSKGGRPKNEVNRIEPIITEENPTEPNESLKEKKEKEKESNVKDILLTENREKHTRFTPPSLDEVRAYCEERKNGIDPVYFMDYQAARNWVLSNGKKAQDWKAVIRTWERNNFNRGGPKTPTKTVVAQQYEQRDYSGVQADLMSEQDREMEEWMRNEVGS